MTPFVNFAQPEGTSEMVDANLREHPPRCCGGMPRWFFWTLNGEARKVPRSAKVRTARTSTRRMRITGAALRRCFRQRIGCTAPASRSARSRTARRSPESISTTAVIRSPEDRGLGLGHHQILRQLHRDQPQRNGRQDLPNGGAARRGRLAAQGVSAQNLRPQRREDRQDSSAKIIFVNRAGRGGVSPRAGRARNRKSGQP